MLRRLDREKLLISGVLALGLLLIILGLNAAVTGREAKNLPDTIETISPGPGDTVLRQSQIYVDLVAGFEAVLVLDGLELPVTRLDELQGTGAQPKPGAQVELPPTAIYDAGNFAISFQPQEGAAITGLFQGRHTASVIFWKVDESREKARSFTWSFTVN